MSCLDVPRIARAAIDGADADHAAHVSTCLACRRELEEQRALHLLARGFPAPPLSRARRSHLAAAVLAEAELTPPRRATRLPIMLAAAAAAVLVVVGIRGAPRERAEAPAFAPEDALAFAGPALTERAQLEVPAELPPARLERTGAQTTHAVIGGRDVFTLADGEVTVDSRSSRDVDVRVADTVVHVATGRVRVRARRGVIQSVQVIVGAAVIETPARELRIDSRTQWLAPPSNADVFGDAWIALRAGRAAQAIALFDGVTDRALVEEAAYWAAIAAKRAGLTAEATRRLTEFLVRFPTSPHAANARALLDAP